MYEATQVQRGIERKIRHWKRQAGALDAAGLDNTYERVKLGEWQARMRDFVKQTGLYRQSERERILGALPEVKAEVIQETAPVMIPEPVLVNYDDTVYKVERKTFANTNEHAAVIDSKGNIIFEKDGDANSVMFTDRELETMKGNTLTHNHPGGWKFKNYEPQYAGNSFSPDDIKLATKMNAFEIRATTPKYIFSMKPGKSGWPNREDMLNSIINKYYTEVREEFLKKLSKNIISPQEAEAEHWHEVNIRMSKFK